MPLQTHAEESVDGCGICGAEDAPGGRGKEDTMVQCDASTCQRWFHISCLAVAPAADDDEWYCADCVAATAEGEGEMECLDPAAE